ncbi:MAG: hypothetical protein ACLFWD_13010 [Anaerolineales bacterium]
MKEILLLDMDNVLLSPLGYRRALQRAIAAVAGALGYQSPDFSDTAIEEIEAAGVTSEWEMAAITAAILMADPAARYRPLPKKLTLELQDDSLRPPPPIGPVFKHLAKLNPDRTPLDRAKEIMSERTSDLPSNQRQAILHILDTARTVDSVIFRTIQEFVLGSETYQSSYEISSVFDIESYLHRYDQPSLAPEIAASLQRRISMEGHAAAIFTNRPSTPPTGHKDTPEAEIGARLVGLEGVPIIGSGDLGWLALEKSVPSDTFLKPSPVHALSALAAALGRPKAEAMMAAWDLASEAPEPDSFWRGLDTAQVFVFEDSARGLRSGLSAVDSLKNIDVRINIELIGISQHPAKRAELEAVGARVYPDVNQAAQAEIPNLEAPIGR